MFGCLTCHDEIFLVSWFLSCSVFNMTDQDGSKLQNKEVIDHIQKVSSAFTDQL
jgi:hypothetical protein